MPTAFQDLSNNYSEELTLVQKSLFSSDFDSESAYQARINELDQLKLDRFQNIKRDFYIKINKIVNDELKELSHNEKEKIECWQLEMAEQDLSGSFQLVRFADQLPMPRLLLDNNNFKTSSRELMKAIKDLNKEVKTCSESLRTHKQDYEKLRAAYTHAVTMYGEVTDGFRKTDIYIIQLSDDFNNPQPQEYSIDEDYKQRSKINLFINRLREPFFRQSHLASIYSANVEEKIQMSRQEALQSINSLTQDFRANTVKNCNAILGDQVIQSKLGNPIRIILTKLLHKIAPNFFKTESIAAKVYEKLSLFSHPSSKQERQAGDEEYQAPRAKL